MEPNDLLWKSGDSAHISTRCSDTHFVRRTDGMLIKPWTHACRKHLRLKRQARDARPARFRLRASLAAVGGMARVLRRHGLEVTVPTRIGPGDWVVTAVAPDGLSQNRLLRLGNHIDRTPALGRLTSVNVRLFRWLDRDRRQKAAQRPRRRASN